MSEQKDYTGYEYKQVMVDRSLESLWKDSMEHFGWCVERSEAGTVKRLPFALWIMAAPLSLLPGRPFHKQLSDHASDSKVEITFKRDRKIARKQELNRLEDQYAHCARAIESLEASKGMTASVASVLVGIVGTACLAAATFAWLAGMTPAFLIAAVPGFLGWIIPYFLYRSMKASKEQAVAPKIEEQHESIYDICKAGSELVKSCA